MASCDRPPQDNLDTTQECSNNVGVTFRTVTETPIAEEVWNRLVAGPSGVFKHLFPQITDEEGRPIQRLFAMPAATSVIFSSNDVTIIPGGPGSGRGPGNAELFFAYIGGVHDYFLKCIQKTIKPEGFGVGCMNAPEEEVPTSGGTCPEVPDSTIPAEYQGAMKENFLRIADIWAEDCPGPENNLAEECYNYVVRESRSAGVNPAFTLTIWANESGASNYCHGGPTTQDFGFNVSTLYQNLVGQLAAFLQLPSANGYINCRSTCTKGEGNES